MRNIIFAVTVMLSVAALCLDLVRGSVSASVTGVNYFANVNSSGVQANTNLSGFSGESDVSTDGNYIVFTSTATNLVASDTNAKMDIFLRNVSSGVTTRISVSSSGTEGNADAGYTAKISNNGKYVVFSSNATNLVASDTNGVEDVFIHNTSTGTTQLVSSSSAGTFGNNISYNPSVSAEGRFVTFQSLSTNLTSDSVSTWNIFVKDMVTGVTTLISKAVSGSPDGHSQTPDISCDGGIITFESTSTNLVSGSDTNATTDIFVVSRAGGDKIENITINHTLGKTQGSAQVSCDGNYVSFVSLATNLIASDTNGKSDVFRYNRQVGTTELVSVTSGGTQGDQDSMMGTISPDGNYISFVSYATNFSGYYSNTKNQVYIKDMISGSLDLVSINASNVSGNENSDSSAVSANGKRVVFDSMADNLKTSDPNGKSSDVFYTDL